MHQNAFHEVDTFTSLEKQYKILKLIYDFHRLALDALNKDADFNAIINLPVREKIGRAKYVPEKDLKNLDAIEKEIVDALKGLTGGEYDE